jgi:hypothetical protein
MASDGASILIQDFPGLKGKKVHTVAYDFSFILPGKNDHLFSKLLKKLFYLFSTEALIL